MSRSGERGCFSGNAATPTQKSPSSLDQPRPARRRTRGPPGAASHSRLRVAGRVAAQREDVAHAGVGVLPDDVPQLGRPSGRRGEVADRGQRGLGGDPLGDARRCGRGSSRRRRRSPRRRSGRSASSSRIACQSCRSPSSVLGGKNSNENERPPAASSSPIAVHGRARRACVEARHGPSVGPARLRRRADRPTRAAAVRSDDVTALTPARRRGPARPGAEGARRLPRPRRRAGLDGDRAPTSRPLVDAIADLLAGGKRLRPGLLLLGLARRRRRRQRRRSSRAAASLELLQACALIHDDVMDGSDTRRGMPAVHRRFAALHRGSGWLGDARGVRRPARRSCSATCAWSGADELLAGCGLPPRALLAAPSRSSTDAHRADGRAVPRRARAGRRRRLGRAGAARSSATRRAKYTVERPLQLGAALAGAPARAARRPTPATACRSARRSSCATTCSACSATRPRPASRPATTCARASGPCWSRWRSSAATPAAGRAVLRRRLGDPRARRRRASTRCARSSSTPGRSPRSRTLIADADRDGAGRAGARRRRDAGAAPRARRDLARRGHRRAAA